MNIITTTKFRKNISKYLMELITDEKKSFVIGRRDNPEAVVIPFPHFYNKNLSDSTNIAMYGGTFDFLKDEPDLYSAKDTREWKAKNKKR